MFRDDHAAAIARLDSVQRELDSARSQAVVDQQRIDLLTAQLREAHLTLARIGHAPSRFYQFPSRGTTILTLGILSLVLCAVMGPIAWAMGNEELRRIDAGVAPPEGRSNTAAGKICGVISSVLMIVGAFFFLLALSMASH